MGTEREYPDGSPIEFTIVTNDNGYRVALAQVVAEELEAIGVRANVETISFDALVGALLNSGDWQATVIGLSFDAGIPERLYGDIMRIPHENDERPSRLSPCSTRSGHPLPSPAMSARPNAWRRSASAQRINRFGPVSCALAAIEPGRGLEAIRIETWTYAATNGRRVDYFYPPNGPNDSQLPVVLFPIGLRDASLESYGIGPLRESSYVDWLAAHFAPDGSVALVYDAADLRADFATDSAIEESRSTVRAMLEFVLTLTIIVFAAVIALVAARVFAPSYPATGGAGGTGLSFTAE